MATDNIERFPGQKPGSICRRHEQRIDGSRLSPGQRAAYGFIQGGSAAGRWGIRNFSKRFEGGTARSLILLAALIASRMSRAPPRAQRAHRIGQLNLNLRHAPSLRIGRTLFSKFRDRDLLKLGVLELYLPRVFTLKTEAELDALASELPEEASEALYMLAAGYSFEQIVAERAGSVPTASGEAYSAAAEDFEEALPMPQELSLPVFDRADYPRTSRRALSSGRRPTPAEFDALRIYLALNALDSKRRFYVVEGQAKLAAMLKTPLADRIREFVYKRLIVPARNAGRLEIEVRAGDVHRNMGLKDRMPAVCAALGPKFEQQYPVRRISRDGPKAGANVYFRFLTNLGDPTLNTKRPMDF